MLLSASTATLVLVVVAVLVRLELTPGLGWSPIGLLLAAGALVALLAGALTWQLATARRRLHDQVRTATRDAAATAGYLRAVMDAAGEAILAVDRQGMVVGANPAAATLLSDGVELRGRPLTQVVPDGVTDMAADIGHVRRTRLTATRLDGSSFAAEVTVTRTADDRLLTVVLRDVTERDAARAALEASTAELERHAAELERLNREAARIDEVKRDFVAMASHEMRTPVTAVQGFAVTLQRHWEHMDDDARRLSIAAIHRQSQRLWHVVSDLLIASEIESGDIHASLAPCDVGQLVRQRCALAGLGDGTVTLEVQRDLVVDLPEAHVERVLDALLSNAQKYGRPPIRVRVTTSQDILTVRVHDSGAGVPPAFRGQLFKRFSQASTGSMRTARGTGLGLAVARGLARAHGGDVVHLGHLPGGCFELSLPIPDDTPSADVPDAATLERTPGP